MHDLALVEHDRKYFANPIIHQLSVHPRMYLMLTGTTSLFCGLGLLGPALHWARPASTTCFLAEIVAAVILVGRCFLPCKCGKTPVLKAKARLGLMKPRNQRSELVQGMVALATAYLMGEGVQNSLSFLSDHFGAGTTWIFVNGSLIALGCLLMIWSANGKFPTNGIMIAEDDQHKVRLLRGETEEELHKLIDFNLKAGYLATADEHSKKLLAMAEEGSGIGKES